MTFIHVDEVQPGTILPYGNAAAPAGYLLCDGSAVSRTTYSGLFAVIAELFGAGDGSTTFNLPDMGGNIPAGIGASGITNIGDTGGEQTHTLITSEMPAHVHANGLQCGSEGCIDYDTGVLNAGQSNTATTGGGGAHENMPPYVGTEWIIKT